MFDTPILFLIFNRPETTKAVFDEIRKAKPSKLFVAADGPRPDNSQDIENCKKARDVINVDWDCELQTLYRDENLGCRHSNNDSISWFFKNVEEGIILEDDIVPSQSLFPFLSEMLERFREDKRIMKICGFNKTNQWEVDKYSYFFSNYGGIWGWATWRRAWELHDPSAKAIYDKGTLKFLEELFKSKFQARVRYDNVLKVADGKLDSWAYPWALTRNLLKGLTVVPTKNLIDNIGFDKYATHTKSPIRYKFIRQELDFPLVHNDNVEPDYKYDKKFAEVSLRNLVAHYVFKFLNKIK